MANRQDMESKRHAVVASWVCVVGVMFVAVALGGWAEAEPGDGGVARVDGVDPMVAPIVRTSDCASSCHSEITDRPVSHGPVASGMCMSCHDYDNPARHTFKMKGVGNDLCKTCHDIGHSRVVHAPVADGACMDCHDPHGSEHENVLVADLQRDLCMTCHEDLTAGKEWVHGPVAMGACVLCHEAHESNNPSLLKGDANRMCLGCHSEIEVQAEVGLEVHGAIDQGCTSCHDPHASDHKFQLHEESPTLCMKCHDHMQSIVDGTFEGVLHGPLRTEESCGQCHNPHSSRFGHLQVKAQPELCLDCHDKEIDIGEARPLTNMKALLANNPSHHGPIREGLCTACHQPHADKNFRLLLKEYPPEFYAPYADETFSLCFTCHIPELVKSENGVGLTGFRDGEKNLHWVHVNQKKGRTCRACHEVHASTQHAHIRESVPFGNSGWELPIGFEKTESGGSCAPACHVARSYERVQKEPLPSKLGE